ncbi:BfmA/BtgA family mobilization protein [Paludibacter sp.]|uniref:BfmA/BtgA family mobilization protein n=1 Tax=Paludibacter sp. TaxID=1898105 RepID=UPI001355BDC2|nr:BfmA/BtgA family mobilization protein [Paludibacter sp.]MTK53119.1 hypothetical protein [Paludibacter sp.]
MTQSDVTVKVSRETKALLDLSRKRITIDDYISSMLAYFSVTGINPRDKIVDRTDKILKRFEDVLKLIRAIEKGRIMKIEDKTDRLFEHIFGTTVIERLEEEPSETTDLITVEELQKIITINETLQQQLDQMNHLLETERKEKEMYKLKASNSDSAYSTSLIKEIKSKIQDISKPAMFDRSLYMIEKGDMIVVTKMLEELLDKNKQR